VFAAVRAAEGSSFETLSAVARDFSPRVEVCSEREVVLDLAGLDRLFGDAKTIAGELRRTAADRALRVRIAIAGTRTAARLLVHHRAGVTIVAPGEEAAALAPLPLALLAVELGPWTPDLGTLRRWGLKTVGEFAALPSGEVAARLGQEGVAWQRLACGEDPRPLLPSVPEERFEEALDLEWPIDALEPLAFVLGRLMESLETHLARRDRGAAVLHVRLWLVDRTRHERSLQLPVPMRDARTLRTLALLDLESHPPAAAVDRVVVAVDPTPGRVVQFSLLTRPLPSPEQLSTLMARLHALMGEDRCGAPVPVDSWRPGAVAMKPFAPIDASVLHSHKPQRHRDPEISFVHEPPHQLCVSESLWFVGVKNAAHPAVALRRFRFPVPARVRVEDGKPSRVTTDRRGLSGGGVEVCAGPWRTSGAWWAEASTANAQKWDRDEWDVTLKDGATYRVFRERGTNDWFLEGIVD
jgi:protein ImuB